MLDEGNTPTVNESPEPLPPEEKSNRTFRIVAGIVAGLVFLTLVCMAVYFLVIAPRTAAQRTAAQRTIEARNTQAVQQLTSTAQAVQQSTSTAQVAGVTPNITSTPLPLQTGTSVPRTPTVSSTPVIALNSPVATATTNPATLEAMQTQLVLQMTSTVASSLGTQATGGQGMPTTGFFDNVGLPSMIILALALVAVIFLARRMRKSQTKYNY
jgi:hypothetical protein